MEVSLLPSLTRVRILLVQPPCDPRERAFPLGLASVASALAAQRHEVCGLDLGAPGHAPWPAAADGFDVIGITAMSSQWPGVRQLVQSLSVDDRRLVLVGGPHATLFPDEVLAEPIVDAAIEGEGDRTAAAAIDTWQSHCGEANRDAPLKPTAGVVWQQRWIDRGFSSDRHPARIEEIDRLSPPDRSLFPLDAFTGMATRRRRYTQIVASRGCRRACAHCPASRLLPGGRRVRPVEQVVAEMRMLRDRFGIDEFHFEDDSLFEDPSYVVSLAGRIREALPHVAWQCPNGCHPADLHCDMLAPLAEAGCYRIYLGLHSTSAAAMQLLQRTWEPASIEPLAQEARRVGLELGGYFTLGLPDQSESDMQATVGFAVESGLEWAQFSPFRFIPGSALFDRREALCGHLPPDRVVQRIIRGAYWRFYASRGRWRSALGNLNSRNALQVLRRIGAKLFGRG